MSRQLSKVNVISGTCTIALGLILLSQTNNLENAFITQGIHPMDYPRLLIYLLLAVGAVITFTPNKGTEKDSGIAIFSKRSCAIAGILVFYALTFEPLGFILSSFITSLLSSICMGWRKIPSLIVINAGAVIIIWCTFHYVLKYNLPSGSFI